ncbi:MAG: rhamnulokinase family protein [Bryobacteraceae bacterium]|jgi:rhamnulokinase
MKSLAIDLGATSGRVMLGELEQGELALEELHRFSNTPVQLPTGFYWDTLRLFHEIRRGLAIAGRERKLPIDAIGVDTWGVDFGLLGEDGALVDNPRHYRDARTNGVMEKAFAMAPKNEIFEASGVQFMQINSLYQWYAMKLAGSPALRVAKRLLFMPDLFNYWLTGVARAERTIASTSQFYDPRSRAFATEMLARLGLDASILTELVDPGTKLGPLLPDLADFSGLGAVPVYASGGHDTAAAVVAVPAHGKDWCFISSGTWSLMGVELDEPVINAAVLAENFTNEAGAAGKVRFLKNIAGMWLLEECRAAWALEGHNFTYEELLESAAAAKPHTAVIDPDAFLEPGHMPARIAEFCKSSKQPVPLDPGQVTRVILESLAERYRQVLEHIEKLTGRRIRVIHIVGGGSQNRLLNQLAANITGRVVIAGPVEATAIGNVLIQAMGAGVVRDLREAREIVARSFLVERFEPERPPGPQRPPY